MPPHFLSGNYAVRKAAGPETHSKAVSWCLHVRHVRLSPQEYNIFPCLSCPCTVYPLNNISPPAMSYVHYLIMPFTYNMAHSLPSIADNLIMPITQQGGVILKNKKLHFLCCAKLLWDPNSKISCLKVAFSLVAGPQKMLTVTLIKMSKTNFFI